jgi:hypothetical protein
MPAEDNSDKVNSSTASPLQRIVDLAREVLRQEGLSDEEIDAMLHRQKVRDIDPRKD